VHVARFAAAEPRPEWRGSEGTIGFLGRLDEPRKGLPTLLAAMETVRAARPGVRLLVAGHGDVDEAGASLSPELRAAVTFLGQVSDEDKARLLRTVDVYVAPNLGGESFGIVLVEAMSAGAPVVASDLDAFERVLERGRAGVLFPTGDAAALAQALLDLLSDPERRGQLRAEASAVVRRYDWRTVADDVLAVYETVGSGLGHGEDSPRRRWPRLGRALGREGSGP
jgi:phosphatidylinositol alpha-mannosyltransferase